MTEKKVATLISITAFIAFAGLSIYVFNLNAKKEIGLAPTNLSQISPTSSFVPGSGSVVIENSPTGLLGASIEYKQGMASLIKQLPQE